MKSREEIIANLRTLAEGWEVLPYDDAERATKGFVFVGSDQREFQVEWPIFQSALRPEKALVTPEELAVFITSNDVCLCDDPKRRLIGFVKYAPEENLAIVRQTKLTQLKGAKPADQEKILTLRTALRNEAECPAAKAKIM